MITKAKTTLFCGILAAAALFAAPALHARAEIALGANASLALPSSYEQYLGLRSPGDVAFSDGHIAIADGSVLYIYDREKVSYTAVEIEAEHTVIKIGFAGERLFVSEQGTDGFSFYEYDFLTGDLEKQTFNCTTFCVDGGLLYTAAVGAETTIGLYDLQDLSAPPKNLGTIASSKTPSLTVLDGNLYVAVDGIVYHRNGVGMFAGDSFYLSADDPSAAMGMQAVCAHGDTLYYTAAGGLYRTDRVTHRSTQLIADYGFGAMTSYGGKLYAVKGTSVVEIEAGEEARYTGYEIASSSPSEGRLSGAVDCVRAGELLVVADAGNRRVSVSELTRGEKGNVIENTYVINCLGEDGMPYTPTLVATDGSLIAVAGGSVIYLYHRGETSYFYRHPPETTSVQGLVCVYGECYYITEFGYGHAKEGETSFPRSENAPEALAADVYGTLYVVNARGEVQSYPEELFADPQAVRGTALDITLPENFRSLRADFEGNLYCLTDEGLFENGDLLLSFGGQNFVYGASDMPASFALGYEDDEIFFQYTDYLVKTDPGAADIPTLSKISADGVYEKAFAPHGEEELFIDIPAGTIGIKTDLAAMRRDDPAYFPYLSYYRTEENMRGVLVARKDRYALVTLYEVGPSSRVFTASLFRTDAPAVSAETYFEEQNCDLYTTNAVSFYDFPCLHPALAESVCARGTAVKVVGYVSAPERDYALTADAEGNLLGYLPRDYLTDVDPIPATPVPAEPAYLKASKSGVLFTADDGSTLLVTERTRAEFTKAENGYLAVIRRDGKTYRATVASNMIDRGESDALRISLIVILTVIAVGIVGAYIYLVPVSYAAQDGGKSKKQRP